jgi:hypothetical protein
MRPKYFRTNISLSSSMNFFVGRSCIYRFKNDVRQFQHFIHFVVYLKIIVERLSIGDMMSCQPTYLPNVMIAAETVERSVATAVA